MRNLYSSIILFLVILITPVVLHAQNPPWLEVGSEWTYQNGIWSGPEHYQFKYGITEETVFAGQACAKMEKLDFGSGNGGMHCRTLNDPYYFYESNDSLFFASELDSSFRLVADFGASAGDSWLYVLPAPPGFGVEHIVVDTFLFTVSNVNLINVEGHELRELELDVEWLGNGDPWLEYFQELYIDFFDFRMIEIIGGNGFFAPLGRYSICDSETNVRFQCYNSENLNYINPLYPSCSFITSIDSPEDSGMINIFPNPANNWVRIDGHAAAQVHRVEVYNLSGQLVHSHTLQQTGNGIIDVSALPAGMYVVHAHQSDRVMTAKFVKE